LEGGIIDYITFAILTFITMGRNKKRKGSRSGRAFRSGGMKQFSPTNDNVVIRGHEVFIVAATGTTNTGILNGNAAYSLTLATLSDRCAALGKLFERWQLMELVVTYFPSVGTTTNGAIAIGIDDDIVENENNTSNITYSSITSLRTSLQTQVYRDASVTWRPVDKTKFYYCDAAGAAGTLPTVRFAAPCSIFGQASATNINGGTGFGVIRFDYKIKFAGAITPSNLTLGEEKTVTPVPSSAPISRGL